jgi:hypothetical protein
MAMLLGSIRIRFRKPLLRARQNLKAEKAETRFYWAKGAKGTKLRICVCMPTCACVCFQANFMDPLRRLAGFQYRDGFKPNAPSTKSNQAGLDKISELKSSEVRLPKMSSRILGNDKPKVNVSTFCVHVILLFLLFVDNA